jgi:hypothetical protein
VADAGSWTSENRETGKSTRPEHTNAHACANDPAHASGTVASGIEMKAFTVFNKIESSTNIALAFWFFSPLVFELIAIALLVLAVRR